MKLNEAFSKETLTLISYLPAGFPDEFAYRDSISVLAKAGFRILEIGLPNKQCNLDGQIIKNAMKRILENGMDFEKALYIGGATARDFDMASVGMLYYETLREIGENKCFDHFEHYGIQGILVPDMPHTERNEFSLKAKRRGLAPIGFIPVRARHELVKEIINMAEGFLYYQSYDGETGKAYKPSKESSDRFSKIKEIANKKGMPIAIGFGIHNKNDLAIIRKMGANGAIIGSAIVEAVGKGKAELQNFIDGLVEQNFE
ncbi:MAG TPA: tryptophan synthase subunit alpha [Rectinema sp.]|nr:tryptophan synthase subunit alpha [Rectinema sp.]